MRRQRRGLSAPRAAVRCRFLFHLCLLLCRELVDSALPAQVCNLRSALPCGHAGDRGRGVREIVAAHCRKRARPIGARRRTRAGPSDSYRLQDQEIDSNARHPMGREICSVYPPLPHPDNGLGVYPRRSRFPSPQRCKFFPSQPGTSGNQFALSPRLEDTDIGPKTASARFPQWR